MAGDLQAGEHRDRIAATFISSSSFSFQIARADQETCLQVQDLGRIYGPQGLLLAEIQRRSQSIITVPSKESRVAGRHVLVGVASVSAEGNLLARNMLKSALKGLPLSS